MSMPTTTEEKPVDVPPALQVGDVVEAICRSWFTRGHGYGFLRPIGLHTDLFTGARHLLNIDALRPGDRVRAEVRMDAMGRLHADGVELMEP